MYNSVKMNYYNQSTHNLVKIRYTCPKNDMQFPIRSGLSNRWIYYAFIAFTQKLKMEGLSLRLTWITLWLS